ncbi:MAG: 3-dehydroquinate synthase [Deltaproteobacteria bacterium]|nr:3-dehydroquinate synthase [Deltaproteobacteria bacterium]
MKTLQVSIAKDHYQYAIKIGESILEESMADLFRNYSEKNVFIVTNETILGFYPDFIKRYIPESLKAHLLVLPDGEKYKNADILKRIYDFLTENRANRRSYLLAFGGGVIGDMTGFAAATFMRGMSYIQIPTTLLSQVDSSIGGKTGINHPAGKNFIGAFKQPLQTIIDTSFLKTLPMREFKAGYAELLKHGLIKDSYLYQILRGTDMKSLSENKELLTDSIYRSCEVKARIVESDEMESGLRAVLNYGHTLGHFIETYTKYNRFLHGEAVIAGMEFASYWSYKNHYLDRDSYLDIKRHLLSLEINLKLGKIKKEDFIEIIEHDKKNTDEGIHFIGLRGIGKADIFEKISAEKLWFYFQEMVTMEPGVLRID